MTTAVAEQIRATNDDQLSSGISPWEQHVICLGKEFKIFSSQPLDMWDLMYTRGTTASETLALTKGWEENEIPESLAHVTVDTPMLLANLRSAFKHATTETRKRYDDGPGVEIDELEKHAR